MVDQTLSELILLMGDCADARAACGHRELESAFAQARLMLIDAAFHDGVQLDAQVIGVQFGVEHD